jgi:hypothetical protein
MSQVSAMAVDRVAVLVQAATACSMYERQQFTVVQHLACVAWDKLHKLHKLPVHEVEIHLLPCSLCCACDRAGSTIMCSLHHTFATCLRDTTQSMLHDLMADAHLLADAMQHYC